MSGDLFSKLANLSDLQKVQLYETKPFDVATAREAGLLAYELGRNRQHVKFEMISDCDQEI